MNFKSKTLLEDAQLAEKMLVLQTPLAREECASKLFVQGDFGKSKKK